MTSYPLCERYEITPAEIERRRAFLGLDAADDLHLARIREVIGVNLESIIDGFYEHLTGFDELARFLDDDATMERLRGAQRQYLMSFGEGADTLAYYEDRLRIGATHPRVGLDFKWYVAAQAKLFELIAGHLAAELSGEASADLAALYSSLAKIQALDGVLTVETYYRASVSRLEAVVEEMTEAERRLEELTRTDPLTEVMNRRCLMESLEMEVYRAHRFGHPFAVLFIDIDHFKRVNDKFGHAVGDMVLKHVADELRAAVRTADVVGRYGGEEFVVGLVECQLDVARRIGERVRRRLAEAVIEDSKISITASIGLAPLRGVEEGLDTLLRRADTALYQAKNTGRNRLCLAEDSADPDDSS